jgi:hypothetical protein
MGDEESDECEEIIVPVRVKKLRKCLGYGGQGGDCPEMILSPYPGLCQRCKGVDPGICGFEYESPLKMTK